MGKTPRSNQDSEKEKRNSLWPSLFETSSVIHMSCQYQPSGSKKAFGKLNLYLGSALKQGNTPAVPIEPAREWFLVDHVMLKTFKRFAFVYSAARTFSMMNLIESLPYHSIYHVALVETRFSVKGDLSPAPTLHDSKLRIDWCYYPNVTNHGW